MKIKAVWGFVGNAVLLGAEYTAIKAGQVFDDVDDEYAHALIGKGLVVEIAAEGEPKQAKPKETKPTAAKESK